MEDVTISFQCNDITPIATPYNDANGLRMESSRMESEDANATPYNGHSQMELDEELHLSPVKFFYSHNDPGQYSIGHTPDLNENDSPSQRAISSSFSEEESKLPVIPEGTSYEMENNLADVKEEEEEQEEDK